MMTTYEVPFQIAGISMVRSDTYFHEKPFRSTHPRTWNSLVLVTGGRMTHRSTNGSCEIDEGELFLVLPNEHEELIIPDGSVTYLFVDFTTAKPLDPDALGLPLVFHTDKPGEYRALLGRLYEAWTSRQPGYLAHCAGLICEILSRMTFEQASRTTRTRRYQKIVPAVAKIEREFAKPLDRQALAEICGVSESTLSRLFLETTGRTPMRYLSDVRIAFAKNELSRGAPNIGELAERCGFSDIYSFSHAFKRAVGVTPSDWADGTAEKT